MVERYSIAIHGGAGINPAKLTPETKQKIEQALERILRFGKEELASGKHALDVVEQVVMQLEDEPLFNAGKGAVFNATGRHELDASIMDGKTLQCGAVAGVRTVKNPIHFARIVMEKTPHVLLAGDGAEAFAEEQSKIDSKLVLVDNSYFSTPERRREWERRNHIPPNGKATELEDEEKELGSKKGTVGCVVLDRFGNLAAATSTGGLTNKKFGRVGDSPIIGAGTYANNQSCAVSCTGAGEHFIRHAVAYQVSARMLLQEVSLQTAVEQVMFKVLEENTGGLISVDHQGEIVMLTNTPGMSRGAANSKGLFEVSIGR